MDENKVTWTGYEALRELRKKKKESQSRFWSRFGVTQACGSRFESGMRIPASVSILLKLYFEGVISDGDLWRVKRRPASALNAASRVNQSVA